MFTGIIENTGRILSKKTAEGCLWTIETGWSAEEGDSVSVEGVCHTVTRSDPNRIEVFSSPETLAISAIGRFQEGQVVNLERSLKLGERLDGHLVYGHVDCSTELMKVTGGGASWIFTFALGTEELRYLIPKGSITINGVSLTVYQKNINAFSVMVIPHTYSVTTLKSLKPRDRVNLEFDPLGKYIENFISRLS